MAGRGNNLHEVSDHAGHSFLVSMPTKFRKNVWIKRGDFVIVTHIEEGDKVKAEISTILYKDQISFIKSENQWPEGFSNQDLEENVSKLSVSGDHKVEISDSEDSEDDSDLFQNTNRPAHQVSEQSESESDSDKE